MQTLIEKFMEASAGIAAAAIAGTIWLNLRWLFSSRRSMDKILKEISAMQAHLRILYTLQGPILISMKASLEAQRDGKCNGNVDEAIQIISEEKKKFDQHLIDSIGYDSKEDR